MESDCVRQCFNIKGLKLRLLTFYMCVGVGALIELNYVDTATYKFGHTYIMTERTGTSLIWITFLT